VAYDEKLAERVRAALAARRDLSEKKMFGGIAFLLSGNMCCGVTGDDLMLRVGAAGEPRAFRSPHARPCDFTGRPMRGIVMVRPSGYRGSAALRRWVDQAVAFAGSLPPK
jgi:TfoX/Sxy family transcriptional regulator of competence genes